MVTKMFGDLDFEAMDREDAEADECLRRLRVAQQPLIRKTFDPDEQQHAIVVEPTPKRIDANIAELLESLSDEIGTMTGALERRMNETDERMLAKLDAAHARLDQLNARLDALATELDRSSVVPLKRGVA